MKKFVAYWSTDFSNPGLQILGPEAFTEEFCYSPKDIFDISSLKVGETWQSPHYGYHHTIIRIE